jgi:hypothetical protein
MNSNILILNNFTDNLYYFPIGNSMSIVFYVKVHFIDILG